MIMMTHHLSNSNLLKLLKINQLVRHAHYSCKVLVVGGGTAGCTMAAKLSRNFNKAPNHVIVIEPSEEHYYQPLFTLVGGGIKSIESAKKRMVDVLPKKAEWLKDKVVKFQPDKNTILTQNGNTVQYEFMVVAMGLELYWDKLPGLLQGLKDPDSQVCSIYGPNTVSNVYDTIKKTIKGEALFTFPNTPVKCPGAPQKIAYLSEDYWSRNKKRNDVNVIYNTSLPVIFGVKKYADALWKVCKERNIEVRLNTNLIEIKPDKKEAIFQNLKNLDEKFTVQYSMLHVTPPMGPPEILKTQKVLVNDAGFLNVSPETLQSCNYKNVYGIGDCTNTPNSKTMAAIASQSKVVYENIMSNLTGKKMLVYNGYSSCPLVTSPNKCILAEFDYKLRPQETFPVNQGKELFSMFLLKKYFFPFLYWNLMLKGYWSGPEKFRKIFSIIKKEEPAIKT